MILPTIPLRTVRAEQLKIQKFEIQNRQLQKAESLGRMAGAIAHHFNYMLGAVIGNLELANMDLPSGSDAVKNLTQAMKASHRAAEVSILMLTYLGQTPGKHEPLDLSENCHLGLPMRDLGLKTGDALAYGLRLPESDLWGIVIDNIVMIHVQ